jgi:hypothetical protein
MLKLSERKFRLQLFAEGDAGSGDATGTDTAEKIDTAAADQGKGAKDAKDTKAADEKKYSDADLDEIINKKFAKWQDKKQKEVEEAEKLAKMSAEEKIAHERDKLKQELDDLKREKALSEMSKTARKLLGEKNITVSDELLSLMVTTDATETKAAIDSFTKLFNESVENAVKERLRGEVPKVGTGGSAPISEIDKRIKKYQ